MRIAILTSGILPVPAVKGGAVENLTDFLLQYNDRHRLHHITVYSIANEATQGHPALQSQVNRYVYIETKSLWAKIMKRVYKLIYGEGYYHYTIEYYFRKAWQQLSKHHYDVILLENRPGYALHIDVPQGTRLFYHLHNDLLNSQTKDCQQLYDRASRIITVSQYIASRVRTINAHDQKCVAILNGIDLQAFSPDIKSQLTRQQLGLADDDFVMLFSGRVTAEKGVAQLIQAMIRLCHLPALRLLIIGSPFYGDSSNEDHFVRSLKQQAEPVRERIRFTGFIPYSAMPQYLKLADVAVIPSLWDDPCPTTVLEAQAMALPIITTRRGGIPEEVTEENAVMLDTDESFVDNLAEAIHDLYQHPEKRQAMSHASLARAAYFNNERYAADVFKALSTSVRDKEC